MNPLRDERDERGQNMVKPNSITINHPRHGPTAVLTKICPSVMNNSYNQATEVFNCSFVIRSAVRPRTAAVLLLSVRRKKFFKSKMPVEQISFVLVILPNRCRKRGNLREPGQLSKVQIIIYFQETRKTFEPTWPKYEKKPKQINTFLLLNSICQRHRAKKNFRQTAGENEDRHVVTS